MFKHTSLFVIISFVFTSVTSCAQSQGYWEEILSYEGKLLTALECAKSAESNGKANLELFIEQIQAIKPYRWSLFLETFVASGRLFLVSQQQTPKTMKLIEKVATAMELEELPFVFVSRDAGFFNAFAVKLPFMQPFVVVGKSLFERLSDDELEVLLAHELAHVKCRHTCKSLKLAVPFFALYAGIAVYQTILDQKIKALDGFYFSRSSYESARDKTREYAYYSIIAEGSSIVSSLLHGVISLGYSRHNEREADRMALKVTNNPQALIDLMHHLEEEIVRSGKKPNKSSWFSTHPTCQERIAHITEEARKMGIAF